MKHHSIARAPLSRAISAVLTVWPCVFLPPGVAAQNVDLGNLGGRGFSIVGFASGGRSGFSVSGAGDVNGDGLADLIIGAPSEGNGNGASYVVFGKANSSSVVLSDFAGFRVGSPRYSGRSVSGAGDVNGDGLADLIVGAPDPQCGYFSPNGNSLVVFGDRNLGGVAGFSIIGAKPGDCSGISVSGAGDVNGDGFDDLIIGSYGYYAASRGDAFVVFGKTSNTSVDLDNLGTNGFSILGDSRPAPSVAGAGDVNGDGLADVIIGGPSGSATGGVITGLSHVIFGKTNSAPVQLSNLGNGGFRIEGIDSGDGLGDSVSGAGDVNGDGLGDVIVGAGSADPGGNSSAGESYVVFGKADSESVALANLGVGGFRIDGININDESGASVSGAGDVNGDGLADLIVGTFVASPGAGEAYVVYGKTDNKTVKLASLGVGGFKMSGIAPNDAAGFSVSGAGDVNGDGLADLIIGAPFANGGVGESYVVFSDSERLQAATYQARNFNDNPPRIAVGVSGDGSNDDSPDARFWIDFANGNEPQANSSLESVTLTPSRGSFSGAGARVSWRLQTTRQNWTAGKITLRYLESELLTQDENHLWIVYSPTGNAPFTWLLTDIDPVLNTAESTITGAGYFYIGSDKIFVNGLEPIAP